MIVMIIITLIIIVYTILFLIFNEESSFSSVIMGCLCGIFVTVCITLNQGYHITIQKSSDSDWELSDKNYNDTTITKVVIIKADTLYPSIQYKRIKLN